MASIVYCALDLLYDVADVVVGHPRAGWEAYTDLEERFRDAVCVGRSVFVDGLLVHGFPQGTAFDSCCVEVHAQGLDIVAGLAVGCGRDNGMCDAGSASDGSGDHLPVGVFLAFDPQVGIESGRT